MDSRSSRQAKTPIVEGRGDAWLVLRQIVGEAFPVAWRVKNAVYAISLNALRGLEGVERGQGAVGIRHLTWSVASTRKVQYGPFYFAQ